MNMNSTINASDAANNTGKIFISLEHNDEIKTEKLMISGKINELGEKLSKVLKRKNKSSDDFKLMIENVEKIKMTHAEIAHWIDTKARWMFPLFFCTFVILYFISIKYEVMDYMITSE